MARCVFPAVKAHLAQLLIERAWQQTLAAPTLDAAPWPWATTRPVARLQWLDESGRVRKDVYLLSGGPTKTLAFAPRLVTTVAPHSDRARLIAADKDTHLAFLQHVKNGDSLRWQNTAGQWRRYAIDLGGRRTTEQNVPWLKPNTDHVWLMACYPVAAVCTGAPMHQPMPASVAFEHRGGRQQRVTL